MSNVVVVMDRLINGGRAKQRQRADVSIELSILSSQRKYAIKRKRSPHSQKARVLARTSHRNVSNKVLVRSRRIQQLHNIHMAIQRGPILNAANHKAKVPPLGSHPLLSHEMLQNMN
jgi:hypothetical protein